MIPNPTRLVVFGNLVVEGFKLALARTLPLQLNCSVLSGFEIQAYSERFIAAADAWEIIMPCVEGWRYASCDRG